MSLALALLGALRAALRTRTDLALENLALRQQLALLSRRSKRPRFGRLDRAFWLWLSNRWSGWRQALYLVRPETVIRWHRQGFRAFWTWKSHRGRPGRPLVGSEIADLVRAMALANPLWGAPRIHGELLKLGLDVSQRSVARLMPHRPKPPSQTWRTFLQNHLADLVSIDFFVTIPSDSWTRMVYPPAALVEALTEEPRSSLWIAPREIQTCSCMVALQTTMLVSAGAFAATLPLRTARLLASVSPTGGFSTKHSESCNCLNDAYDKYCTFSSR